jgi:hypothetical protein
MICLCCLLSPVLDLHADSAPEEQLIAAYVFNFVRFTEWPAEYQSQLLLCAVGNGPELTAIEGLAGKKVKNMTLSYHHVSKSWPEQCHVIYFAADVPGSVESIIDEHGDGQVLTVGRVRDFASKEGMIGLYQERSKIKFEANLDNIHEHKLGVSAQVLDLARIIYD